MFDWIRKFIFGRGSSSLRIGSGDLLIVPSALGQLGVKRIIDWFPDCKVVCHNLDTYVVIKQEVR